MRGLRAVNAWVLVGAGLLAISARLGRAQEQPAGPTAPYPPAMAQQKPADASEAAYDKARAAQELAAKKAAAAKAAAERKAAAEKAAAAKAPAALATLSLRPLWGNRVVSVGSLNPALHQIALRGSLAVVPVSGDHAEVLMLDARSGEVVRRLAPIGAGRGWLGGVVLDGDDLVFAYSKRTATDQAGRLVKAQLDGSYVWISGTIGEASALPVLVDLDRDGTRDVAVVTKIPEEASAWNGVNGEPMWRTPLEKCDLPRVSAFEREDTAALVVRCGSGLQVFDAQGVRTTRNYGDVRALLDTGEKSGSLVPGIQLELWRSLALRGYTALEAPQRTGTCFVDIASHCDDTQAGQALSSYPYAEGAIVGGLLDSSTYGALLLGRWSETRVRKLHPWPIGVFPYSYSVRADGSPVWFGVRVGGSGALADPHAVVTMSADDVDGNGFWDLLIATNDGALRGYATQGSGNLYQGLPHGDLFGTGLPPSEYATIESAHGNARELDALLPSKAKAHSAFEPLQPDWTSHPIEADGRSRRVSLLAASAPEAPIATDWLEGDAKNAQVWPLLRDAHANEAGLFVHDGLGLYSLARGASKFTRIALPAAAGKGAPIAGLAVGERALLLARGGALVACSGSGEDCKQLDRAASDQRRVTAVATGIDPGRFWVGYGDGSIERYDGKLQPAAAKIGAAATLLAEVLLQDARTLIASGENGTRGYLVGEDGTLRDAEASPLQLDQVLRCTSSAPLYALSRGSLLETSTGIRGLGRTQGAPTAVRAIACDRDGGLVVLSADQGAFALSGPSRLWRWTFPLVFGLLLLVLGVHGLLGRRRAKPGEPPRQRDTARNVIVPEEPLERLPDDPNKHPRLRQLVEALVSLIDNEDTRPPATIGIYGQWGSGKSSVMGALRHELLQKRRYISVWFNPWRFHREPDVAAALLQSVVNELRGHMGVGRLEVAVKALGSRHTLLTLSWMLPLAAVSCYFAGDKLPKILSVLWDVGSHPKDLNLETISATVGGGTVLTALFKAGAKLIKVFGVNPSELVKAKSPDKSVDFFERFEHDLKQVTDALPRKQQVIMFVDDLDRCPPDQVLQVLEALNLLAESKRIYLVLAMDPRLVSRAIEMKRKDMLEQMEKRGERTDDYGARFLEKIVTLPVQVPVVSAAEIEQTVAIDEQKPAALSFGRRMLEFVQRDARAVPALWVATAAAVLIALASDVRWAFPQALDATSAPSEQTAKPGGKSGGSGEAEPPPRAAPTIAPPTAPQDKAAGPLAGGSNVGEPQQPAPEPGGAISAASRLHRPLKAPTDASAKGASDKARPALGSSADAPDAAFVRGQSQLYRDYTLLGLLIALGAFVLAVIELRRRDQRAAPPRLRDTEEFAAALRTYLSELPANPRNVVRRANRARLLYQLEGCDCDVGTFFAGLVAAERAEHLRVYDLGVSASGPDVTRFLLSRTASDEFPKTSTAYRVVSSYPPSHFEGVSQTSLPAVHQLSQSLQSWIVDTTTFPDVVAHTNGEKPAASRHLTPDSETLRS